MQDRPDESTRQDLIEELALRCLERLDSAPEDVVDEVCSAHPEQRVMVRAMIGTLRGLGLVDDGHEPQRRFGDFRLLKRIGSGGMGEVWLAEQESLRRRVALKLIRPDLLPFAGARERFHREVQAASRLQHPHLCSVYEAGEIDEVPYLAMRHIEGESVAVQLARRRRQGGRIGEPERRAAVLMIEKVARGLHAAHEVGLVHRDVKPGNILIDREGEPVLVDFGVARDADQERSGLTGTGERLGTPAYMAPEQVSGRGVVDRRTDVYALGVTLYECLTRRCPFESPTDAALYQRIIAEPPPDPRRLSPGIGRELCVVVGKALEKDPDNRFASAWDLAEELRRIREHEPILSRRPGLGLRAWRWCQRNRTATGVMATTLIGLVTSIWFLHQSRLATQQSQLDARRYLALAWLQVAGEFDETDAELAFKCAREALRLHHHPRILARVQEIMFALRQYSEVTQEPANNVLIAPDGRSLVLTRPFAPARLFRQEGDRWRPVQLDTRWRATTQNAPAVFSADGGELALRGLESGTVHRFDLRSEPPERLPQLRVGDRNLWRVRYAPAPEDPRLLLMTDDETVVWTRSGEHLGNLTRAPDSPSWRDAAFLPDGRIVAAGGIWTATCRRIAALPGIDSIVWDVLVGADCFVVWCHDNGLRSFGLDGRLRARRSFPMRDAQDAVSARLVPGTPDRLLVTSGGGRILILDAITLDPLGGWDVGGPEPSVTCSADGQRIVVGTARGQIRIFDREGALLDTLRGHQGRVGFAWSADGNLVAAGRRTRSWSLDVRRGVPAHVALGRPDLAVSPGRDVVVIASDARGSLMRCDAFGRLERSRPCALGRAHVRYLDDDSVVVSSEFEKQLYRWDTDTEPERIDLPLDLHSCPPVLLKDGRWLLFRDWSPQVWSWTPGDAQATPLLARGERCAAVSGDGTRVVLGGWNGTRVWTIGGEDSWHAPKVRVARFVSLSRDGRRVLEATTAGDAIIWDLEAPSEAAATIFSGHQGSLTCAVFSPDETLVATAAEDDAIRIWDRASVECLLQLHHPGVRRIAFTATGQLVSAGEDGTVRWWWVQAAPLRVAIEALGVPELTGEERARVEPASSR